MRWLWAALSLGPLVFAACSGDDSSAPATTTQHHEPAQTGSGAAGGRASAAGGDGGSGAASSAGGAHPTTASSTSTSSGATTGDGGGGAQPGVGGAGGADGGGHDCDVLGEPGDCMDASDCSAMSMHAPWPGFCPGAANIQCCIPDQLLLCDPNTTPMPTPNHGKTTEAPGEGGCPNGMLLVTTFCVDEYEASLVRMSDGSSWSPYYNPGTTEVAAVSVKGAVPQAYIDQVQAGDACGNAGKRLCTDAEWLRACQGPSGDTYPYGDTREPGVCNDGRSLHPAYEYYGTTDQSVFSMLDNACIDQLPESVDPSGSRTGCVTAEGAFDMMGNVHEWTAAPAGTFRGGYYVDTTVNGNGCLYATTAHDTSYWDYSTGFRCCADP